MPFREMSINKLAVIFLAVFISLLSGCASITGTSSQSVSLQTREKTGAEVAGASCELTNNKGKWFVTTPGSVVIHKSNDDMQVICKKENSENGRAAVVSDTKGAMFGNILFGGGIGAVIDHNTGAAYEYPTVIDIVMGDFKKIETPKNLATQQNNNPSLQFASTPTTSTQSNDDKLKELKRLSDAGLISNEAYLEQQRAILSK